MSAAAPITAFLYTNSPDNSLLVHVDAQIPCSFQPATPVEYSTLINPSAPEMPPYNIVVFAGDYCGPEVLPPFPNPEEHKAYDDMTDDAYCRSRQKHWRYLRAAQGPKRSKNRRLTGNNPDPPRSRERTTADQIRLPRTPAGRGTLRYADSTLPPAIASRLTLKVQASIDATGSPLTDEALAAAKNADAVLLGAIGGPVRLAFPTLHYNLPSKSRRWHLLPRAEIRHGPHPPRTRPPQAAQRAQDLRQPPPLQLRLGLADRHLPSQRARVPRRRLYHHSRADRGHLLRGEERGGGWRRLRVGYGTLLTGRDWARYEVGGAFGHGYGAAAESVESG